MLANFILTTILGLKLKVKEKLIPLFKTIISSPKSYTWTFFASLGISAFVLLRWIDYPLSDFHGFRQAQTAITSLFMLKEFSFFTYQTPVVGYPWAIPFELPVYQTIVTLLCKVTHLDLTVCGRLIAWTFCVLTLYPVYKISTKFEKDKTLFYIIGALYLVCPIYLFWARTFMIETTTVFFGTMFLYYFIRIVDEGRLLDFILGLFFSLLCILSKATSYPPFVVAGALYWLYFIFKNKKINYLTALKLGAIGFISLTLAILWVHHSDVVKAQNMIGRLLTSKALGAWNYGTLAQRLSLDTYTTLLFKHIIPCILGNVLGLLLLFATFVIAPRHYKKFFGFFAVLFCIPMAIFTNLYYVHSYYFSANAIFLIAGIGLLLYGLFKSNRKKLTFLLFILMWAFMLRSFPTYAITKSKQRVYNKVGEFIQANTPEDSAIIVIGNDWSSETNYYSKRKGLAAANFITEEIIELLLKDPDAFMGNIPVSAIIYYPSKDNKIIKLKDDILLKYPAVTKHRIKKSRVYITNVQNK